MKRCDRIRLTFCPLNRYEGTLLEIDGEQKFGLMLQEIERLVMINLNSNSIIKILTQSLII
jgi:hypothetical protein